MLHRTSSSIQMARERIDERSDLFFEWCYLCAKWVDTEDAWTEHYRFCLDHLQPRRGLLRFRFTLVAPGFCPFCLGDHTKTPAERFQQWREKSTLINHIDDKHLAGRGNEEAIQCPHPCCKNRFYNSILLLQRLFVDAHSIEEPRRNCVSRKRKWVCGRDDSDMPPKMPALD